MITLLLTEAQILKAEAVHRNHLLQVRRQEVIQEGIIKKNI
jgi:hypothetical protein